MTHIRSHAPYTPTKGDQGDAADDAVLRGVDRAAKARDKNAEKSWGAKLLELLLPGSGWLSKK